METNNRPRGHERKVTGTGTVNKKGSGLGLGGPLGNTGGLSGRPGGSGGIFGGGSGGSGGPVRRGGGFGCGSIVLVIAAMAFMMLRSCMSGSVPQVNNAPAPTVSQTAPQPASGSGTSGQSSSGLESLFDLGGFQDYYGSQGSSGSSSGGMDLESLIQSLYGGALSGASSSESDSLDDSYTQSQSYVEAFDNNTTISNSGTGNANGTLNETTSGAAREKFTKIRGKGKDKVTVMVYMCGTDLESKYGMGTSDIKEMASADLSDKVHVLVYTGGCKRWQNSFTSNSTNQIYEVVSGGLNRLEEDFGRKAMTDPATLTEFIGYGTKKYPADRYELIFWDHGSGTISGYGYDEKFPNARSMTLAGIDKAVTDSGVKFDFIGFDACLMATLENALILSDNADYLIASEETEPGTGWYYKQWLTTLSQNTSTPTVEIGRMIADDFLMASKQVRQGDSVTLSITDLAELGETVPSALAAFSGSTSELIRSNDYKKVSDARKGAREFAASNRIDQVDMVDMALRMGTDEAKALAEAIQSAVKYNRTSRSYGDAHGLSVYFPYRKMSAIDTVTRLYKNIGIDNAYTRCITDFANVAASGQAAGGGMTSPFSSLFGGSSTSGYEDLYSILGGGSSSSGSGSSSGSSIPLEEYSNLFGSGSGSNYQSSTQEELVSALLGSLLGGGSYGRIANLDDTNTEFLEEDSVRRAAEYVFENHLDTNHLYWTSNNKGQTVLALDKNDWAMLQDAALSVLYDDGEGYIDLGADNVFNYDDNGSLLAQYDQTWMALDGHVVAYYFLDEVAEGDEYASHGYIPAFVNGELSDIMVTFDNANPYGIVTGYRPHYGTETTDTIAKTAPLKDGDKLTFICDYYSYDGEFQDNYEMDSMVVSGDPEITYPVIGNNTNASYRLTDIYGQVYWTPLMPE